MSEKSSRGNKPAQPCEVWEPTQIGKLHTRHAGMSIREAIAKDILAGFVAAGGHEILSNEGHEPETVEAMLIDSTISLTDKLIAKLEATK